MTRKIKMRPAQPSDAEPQGTKGKKRDHSIRVWLTKAEKDFLRRKAIEVMGAGATINDLARTRLWLEPASVGAPKGNQNAVGGEFHPHSVGGGASATTSAGADEVEDYTPPRTSAKTKWELRKEKLPEHEQLLERFRSSHMLLARYTDIEPEDVEAVCVSCFSRLVCLLSDG